MLKRYVNLAFTYAIIALAFGVFYREFTKFSGFSGKTSLSILHTHYFVLGMLFFLVLMLVEKAFSFSSQKHVGKALVIYNVGLNIAGIGFLMRGVIQVLGTELSSGLNASISGISGIGHILLSVGLIWLLLQIKKKIQ